MNIAVNARLLQRSRMEGICRYIHETTKRMVLNQPDHTFYFFFDRPYDEFFIYADNVIPVVVGPQARHPILWYLWFEWVLPYQFKKYKIDVFYSGDTYLSLRSKVPTLLVSHDIAYAHYPDHIRWSHLKHYQYYFPKYHHRADHIVAVSEFTKQDIIEKYKLEPDKVSVGYNASPEGFKILDDSKKDQVRQKLTNGAPYFIYVGSLHPRKNVVNLIKAFDLFKATYNTSHKLVLVGRMAWNNEELKEVSKKLSHKEDIIFTGHLEHSLPEYLAAADALTYVSVFEGFGIPILESMMSGVPVITSNVSSMPEVAGNAALLIDPKNPEEISEAMFRIVDNVNLRNSLVEKGQGRVNFFSWDDTAKHNWKVLLQLANSK